MIEKALKFYVSLSLEERRDLYYGCAVIAFSCVVAWLWCAL